MGSTVSVELRNPLKVSRSCFIGEHLLQDWQTLATDITLRDSFANYVKSGTWIAILNEYDNKEKYFSKRRSGAKNTRLSSENPFGDYKPSPEALVMAQQQSKKKGESSTRNSSTRSSFSGRSVTDQPACNMGDLYAHIDGETFFTRDQMVLMLLAMLYPAYQESRDYSDWRRSRKSALEGKAVSISSGSSRLRGLSYDSILRGGTDDSMPLGVQRVEALLVSAAALIDEYALMKVMTSGKWISELLNSIYELSDAIVICRRVAAAADGGGVGSSSAGGTGSNMRDRPSDRPRDENDDDEEEEDNCPCSSSDDDNNTTDAFDDGEKRVFTASLMPPGPAAAVSDFPLHYWNKSFCHLTGTTHDQLSQQQCDLRNVLRFPENEEQHANLFEQALQRGTPLKIATTLLQGKLLPRMGVSLLAVQPVFDQKGNYIYAIVVVASARDCVGQQQQLKLRSLEDMLLLLPRLLIQPREVMSRTPRRPMQVVCEASG